MPAGLDPWALVGQSVDTSGLTPAQKAQFNYLMTYQGVPPDVARSIATNPQYEDGTGAPSGWAYPYRGQAQDEAQEPQGKTYERGLTKQFRGNRYPREQDINYQPGGSQMPGMLGDSAASGQSQMSPQDIARMRLVMQIMGNRGPGGMAQNPFGGGMQFGQNAPGGGLANQLANPGQQGGGLMAMILQNPQLLQWFMQQQGGAGQFPQAGGGYQGGVTLAQLLGAPQQGTPT